MSTDEDSDLAEARLWNRALGYIEQSSAFKLFSQVVLVLVGTTMAGIAQLPTTLSDTQKTGLGILGVVLAFVGGILLVFADRGHPALMDEMRDTLQKWRAALRERDALNGQIARLDAERKKATDLILNFDGLVVLLEETMALDEPQLKQRLDRFVGPAAPGLVSVMELGGSHNWTLSVFCKQMVDGEWRMVRLSSNWMDREEQDRDLRSWRRGKGWTGEAWRKGEEHGADSAVVERDVSTVDAQARYDTDGQEEPLDYTRFRSVAAVPFRDNRTREVIGVVTATSSRVAAFDVDNRKPGRRNLDTIKSFARLAALIVTMHGTAK